MPLRPSAGRGNFSFTQSDFRTVLNAPEALVAGKIPLFTIPQRRRRSPRPGFASASVLCGRFAHNILIPDAPSELSHLAA